MRLMLTGLLSVALLSGQAALADPCAQPRDQSAFGVASLKSELMVIALTCDVRDKYNSFVLQHRAQLQTQDKALNQYFARAFGRRAQQAHDDYITQLANAQSESGLARGTLFCQDNAGMFDEVLAIPAGGDLPTYASTKNLTQAVSLVACPVKPAAQVRVRSAHNAATSNTRKRVVATASAATATQ